MDLGTRAGYACHTPDSETNVPVVTWPRKSVPPVEMSPDPMGN